MPKTKSSKVKLGRSSKCDDHGPYNSSNPSRPSNPKCNGDLTTSKTKTRCGHKHDPANSLQRTRRSPRTTCAIQSMATALRRQAQLYLEQSQFVLPQNRRQHEISGATDDPPPHRTMVPSYLSHVDVQANDMLWGRRATEPPRHSDGAYLRYRLDHYDRIRDGVVAARTDGCPRPAVERERSDDGARRPEGRGGASAPSGNEPVGRPAVLRDPETGRIAEDLCGVSYDGVGDGTRRYYEMRDAGFRRWEYGGGDAERRENGGVVITALELYGMVESEQDGRILSLEERAFRWKEELEGVREWCINMAFEINSKSLLRDD